MRPPFYCHPEPAERGEGPLPCNPRVLRRENHHSNCEVHVRLRLSAGPLFPSSRLGMTIGNFGGAAPSASEVRWVPGWDWA